MSDAGRPSEHEVHLGALRIASMERGAGKPLLVLHHSTGNAGWERCYELLSQPSEVAQQFAVIVPDLPGYGQSTLPEWGREPRDLAILVLQYLRKRQLKDAVVLGLGFGGWIAAELATMDPRAIASMILVGAPGLKPEEGEIMDQMVVDHADYVRAGFRDEATATRHLGETVDPNLLALWQFNRVMTARMTWKPYMFNLRLPPLLAEVPTPALIVHGSADRVVPLAVAQQYERALPHARLEVVEDAGHLVEIEEPERVAELVRAHVASPAPSLHA